MLAASITCPHVICQPFARLSSPFLPALLVLCRSQFAETQPVEGPGQPICHGNACEPRNLSTATEVLSFEIYIAPQ